MCHVFEPKRTIITRVHPKNVQAGTCIFVDNVFYVHAMNNLTFLKAVSRPKKQSECWINKTHVHMQDCSEVPLLSFSHATLTSPRPLRDARRSVCARGPLKSIYFLGYLEEMLSPTPTAHTKPSWTRLFLYSVAKVQTRRVRVCIIPNVQACFRTLFPL